MNFYSEILKIILFLGKGHFLSNIRKGSVRLPDADFFWINPCYPTKINLLKVINRNIFNVRNKDTRMMSFPPFSSDFIAAFERVNVYWVRTLLNIYDGAF